MAERKKKIRNQLPNLQHLEGSVFSVLLRARSLVGEVPRRWLDCFKSNPAGGNVWYVSISCTRCKVHSMHLQCVGQLPPYKLATEVTTPSLWTRPFWKIPPSLIPPSSPSRGLLLAIAMPIVTVDRCYRQWTCTNKALVHVYGFFIWWIYALQICLGFFPVAKEWVMGEGWVIRFSVESRTPLDRLSDLLEYLLLVIHCWIL